EAHLVYATRPDRVDRVARPLWQIKHLRQVGHTVPGEHCLAGRRARRKLTDDEAVVHHPLARVERHLTAGLDLAGAGVEQVALAAAPYVLAPAPAFDPDRPAHGSPPRLPPAALSGPFPAGRCPDDVPPDPPFIDNRQRAGRPVAVPPGPAGGEVDPLHRHRPAA